MRDPEKLKEEMDERKRKILDVAFELFVDKKIEAVSMGDIARAADVGRATLFRYYPSKLELVIAVCADQWKRYLDGLDARRPISSVHDSHRQTEIYHGQLHRYVSASQGIAQVQ